MFFSAALAVVFKTTGGRIWNKPWGLPRLSRTRKANRRKNLALFNRNVGILKAASAAEPLEPVRINTPLPDWQRRHMARHLARAQRAANWRDGLLPPAAAAALRQAGGGGGPSRDGSGGGSGSGSGL